MSPFINVCGKVEGGWETFVLDLKNEILRVNFFLSTNLNIFKTFEHEFKNGRWKILFFIVKQDRNPPGVRGWDAVSRAGKRI
jgi:hypothetical protein